MPVNKQTDATPKKISYEVREGRSFARGCRRTGNEGLIALLNFSLTPA
jgi:hypothetical protein